VEGVAEGAVISGDPDKMVRKRWSRSHSKNYSSTVGYAAVGVGTTTSAVAKFWPMNACAAGRLVSMRGRCKRTIGQP
jgi:hypothetical protein